MGMLDPKKKVREPTYGDECAIRDIARAVDELATVLRRSRDSANMRHIIYMLHNLQQQAAQILIAEG